MTALLDHIGLPLSAFEKARDIYMPALAELGYRVVQEGPNSIGFGIDKKPEFTIYLSSQQSAPAHIAFTAGNRAQVDAFYHAALAAGAQDNGEPGLRPEYHAHYYGAFLLDPDGNNIEAVCHDPG